MKLLNLILNGGITSIIIRTQGGRSGYEHFPEDGNNNYVIAQFYPRYVCYDNVEGWQNDQFWGRSEFALEFGDFTVNITTPADHMLGATGVLQNRKEVFTKNELKRFAKARKTFDNPVIIRTQEEAEKLKKVDLKKQKLGISCRKCERLCICNFKKIYF